MELQRGKATVKDIMILSFTLLLLTEVAKIESQSQNGCLSLPGLGPGGGCCDSFIFRNCRVKSTNSNGTSTYCYCDKRCYNLGDCCDDILEIGCADLRDESEFSHGCLSHPDLGPESGCCNLSTSSHCIADSTNSSDSSKCSCDDTCHDRNDCCDDILEIGCFAPEDEPTGGCLSHPELSSESGCCNKSLVDNCTIPKFRILDYLSCHCNEACYYFDNCCDDIHQIGCFDLRNESEFSHGCLSHPDLGPESGCCDPSTSPHCKADRTNSSDSSKCFCDKSCHYLKDCCDDITEIGCFVISVGFSSQLMYGSESEGHSHFQISWNVSRYVPIITDYYVLPLMYRKKYDADYGNLTAKFQQILGTGSDHNLPAGAVKGEDFVGEPIPFSIDIRGLPQSGEIGIEILLLDDDRFEPRMEGFLLLIMVNESTTNRAAVILSPASALFQILDDNDSFTMGFAEESVSVQESLSSNRTVAIPLRIANGNITEVPLIIRFIVDNSSTATPGIDYEELDNTSVIITNTDELFSLDLTIYNDAEFSEPNETIVISLSVDFGTELDDADAASLRSRIIFDLSTTTITIMDSGVSCYSSTDCGVIDGMAPFVVTSLEDCCLQNPFQPRSFEVPLASAKATLGLQCTQCIVVGFNKNQVIAMEGTSTPDDLQVQFLSGSSDHLLDSFDVMVTVQLSNESTAVIGKNFELDSNPIEAELTQSKTFVRLGGIQIGHLEAGEGNKSFIMEIINVTFLEKQEKDLSLDQTLKNCLFVHKILNQAEVMIVNGDEDTTTSVVTPTLTVDPRMGISNTELLVIIVPSSIFFLICTTLIWACFACYLSRKWSKRKSNRRLIEELELKVEPHPYTNMVQVYRAPSAINVDPKDIVKLGGTSLILGSQLKALESIGEGEFGIVQKGHYYHPDSETPTIVAIKSLKGDFSEEEVHAFLEESIQMKEFSHPHVMGFLGVSLDFGTSPYLILPFMAGGSLLTHLKKKRSELVLRNDSEADVDQVQKHLISMCLQISQGMEYISSKKFVHRDLAARNCMLDGEGIIKVADFGLSKGLYEKLYFREDKKEGVKLPAKWMAIESLQDGVFSEKTDVWSFGVTCWEVFTGGKIPYPGMNPLVLTRMLSNGERMEIPDNAACSEEIFQLSMLQCWMEDPEERPTFSQLVVSLSSKLTEMANYLDLNEMNETAAASAPESVEDAM